MTTVAAFGMGRIGGEAAYLSAVTGFADELILYDINMELLEAQKFDILHGLDLPISTDVKDMKNADYCIFSAGYSRTPDVKTRADLFYKNLPIAKEGAKKLKGFAGKLIVMTNPMDVFTWYFAKHAGLDKTQVVGFGGLLDSRRFTLALHHMGIERPGIVIGEHGENQVPLFSRLPMEVPLAVREEVLQDLRGSSMPVIRGKGGTVFGPAYHLAHMLENIEHSREIVCSLPADGAYGVEGCSIGLPAKVTKNGAKINESLKLDAWEFDKLNAAASFLQGICRRV